MQHQWRKLSQKVKDTAAGNGDGFLKAFFCPSSEKKPSGEPVRSINTASLPSLIVVWCVRPVQLPLVLCNLPSVLSCFVQHGVEETQEKYQRDMAPRTAQRMSQVAAGVSGAQAVVGNGNGAGRSLTVKVLFAYTRE